MVDMRRYLLVLDTDLLALDEKLNLAPCTGTQSITCNAGGGAKSTVFTTGPGGTSAGSQDAGSNR